MLPSEVDVFSGPHSRMKELVEYYSEKLHCTDFSSNEAMESLLHSLYQTFCEFKTHEQIENQFIMEKLKNKLKALSIQDSSVCNCHNDSQLTDMLKLVKDGYLCAQKSHTEKLNYGIKLQHALEEFTKEFLPHMQEEEEVFQPMLIKYFGYDELKSLKELVLLEHSKCRKQLSNCEKFTLEEVEKSDLSEEEPSFFSSLPPELLNEIFSYLNPLELLTCSSVCRTWNQISFQPRFWSKVSPAKWTKGIWDESEPMEEITQCNDCRLTQFYPSDEDADVDETVSQEDWQEFQEDHHQCPGSRSAVMEFSILHGLVDQLLPKVGTGVKKLDLGGCKRLTNSLYRSMLKLCPNLKSLNVTNTQLTDTAFKGPNPCQSLETLNISSCLVSDEGLLLLAKSFEAKSCGIKNSCSSKCQKFAACSTKDGCKITFAQREHKLKHLSLSGCYQITDIGLSYLASVGLSKNLTFIDLSGCWQLSGSYLKRFVSGAPFLSPENLFYCSEIQNGPYEDEANGCQNLGGYVAHCCRSE